MINFYEITFTRMAVHQVMAKDDGQEHAIAIIDNNLVNMNPDVLKIIQERIAKAASHNSKAFILEIEDSVGGSFFSECYKMKDMDNDEFIKATGEIAHKLAKAQTKNTMPGGYCIVIEAYTRTNQMVYITIKAELHEALRFDVVDERPRIDFLNDVFLTPSQKMYKIGVIFERRIAEEAESPEEEEEVKHYADLPWPNNDFGCFLYDSQFSPDSKPAEYFYKEFLGFTFENNAKIQSKKFFENTENFIKQHVPAYEQKKELLDVLKHEFLSNDELEVQPLDFASAYFEEPDLQENYAAEVASYLPEYIIKDASLIKGQLERKKISFPNKITIAGPNNTFDYSVEFLESKEDFENFEDEKSDCTYIKISGKPFTE